MGHLPYVISVTDRGKKLSTGYFFKKKVELNGEFVKDLITLIRNSDINQMTSLFLLGHPQAPG